jgi:hypothetical protein
MLSACGYTLVKRSKLNSQPRTVVDSAAVISLRQQLAYLQAQCQADSTRYANTKPPVPPPSDSLVRARDAEIASLKEQLSKALDELDRIKRRLANPKS